MAPKFPERLRSIQNLQDIFTGNWFPGKEADKDLSLINPVFKPMAVAA